MSHDLYTHSDLAFARSCAGKTEQDVAWLVAQYVAAAIAIDRRQMRTIADGYKVQVEALELSVKALETEKKKWRLFRQ